MPTVRPPIIPRTPIPTPIVETPTPTPTPTPAPTPTPTPVFLQRDVEGLVWEKVNPCAQQVAIALGGKGAIFELVLASRYSSLDRSWRVEASSKEPLLTFGAWSVKDGADVVAPADRVARQIATPGITCATPTAFLSPNLTPPQFVTAATPTPTRAPAIAAPLVTSAQQAAIRVWEQVYQCYGHFPQLGSFTAVEKQPGVWEVEGKSTDTQYGLWQVDAATGTITPIDRLARRARESCSPASVAVNTQQAQLRVWIAVYNCFGGLTDPRDPPPAFADFKAYVGSPQQWIVEGRREQTGDTVITILRPGGGEEKAIVAGTSGAVYGLWFVATDTGKITPWDRIAQQTAVNTCYQPP